MRSLQDILFDCNEATSRNDVEWMLVLADELHAIDTPESRAHEDNGRGLASFFSGFLDEAVPLVASAFAAFQELGISRAAAGAASNIGMVLAERGAQGDALTWYEKALGMLREQPHHIFVANIMANIGVVHAEMGDFPTALEWYEKARGVHEANDNTVGTARLMNSMANVLSSTGNYPEALELLERSRVILEDVGDRMGVAMVMNGMASVYQEMGAHEDALRSLEVANRELDALGDMKGVAITANNIGSVLEEAGRLDEALKWHTKALGLFAQMETRDVPRTTGDIGLTHLRAGRLDDAREILVQLHSMSMDAPEALAKRIQLEAQLNIADGDLGSAEALYNSALELAREHGYRALEAKVHLELRDIARKRSDLDAYILHGEEHSRIREEIAGKDAALRMAM